MTFGNAGDGESEPMLGHDPPHCCTIAGVVPGSKDGLEREDSVCQPKGRGGRWQAPASGAATFGEKWRRATVDGKSSEEE